MLNEKMLIDMFSLSFYENKIFLDFLNYHNSEKYYEEFVSIFEDELNRFYPNLINSTRSLIKKNGHIHKAIDTDFYLSQNPNSNYFLAFSIFQ